MRASRAAVAGGLLAALFAGTAVLASSSTPARLAGGANKTAATPEVLARYAPPALPAELRRHVQAMFDVRSPGAGQLSPDGGRLFFNWSVTGSSQVWRIDGPQRFPVQLTGGEDPTILKAVMPDGRHIVVSRDRGGAENPGLYLQPADGGPLEPIFQKDGVRAALGFIADDGASIFYTANDRKPDAYAIYRYDLATRHAELVFGEDGLWSIADHRPDGRLLLARATGSTSSEYYGFDPATNEYATSGDSHPIEWIKVHDLPDFVYFNHSIHVNKGVGCSTCHGQVDRMPLVRQIASLQMEWCIACHRAPEKALRPRSEIYNMAWEPSADQLKSGSELKRQYNIKNADVLTSCSTCHR